MPRKTDSAAKSSPGRRTWKTSRERSGSFVWLAITLVVLIIVAVAWLYWSQPGSGAKRGTFSEAAQSTLHLKPGQQKPSAGKPEIAPETSIPRALPPVAAPAATTSAPTPSMTLDRAIPSHALSQGYRAERKGLRNGCKSGALSLQPAGFVFDCPADTTKSVSVSLADVKGPDEDGIETVRHEKYHFKIEGKSKEETRTVFEEWWRSAIP